MATRVVASAAGLPVAVVCDDAEVAAWARELGALVIWEPGRGLNGAVHEGVARLAAAGAGSGRRGRRATCPLATDLRWITRFPGVTIVPDRRRRRHQCHRRPDDGGFTFSYGPGSFARHLDEARRLGLPIRVVHSTRLGWDVDVPDDLAAVNR